MPELDRELFNKRIKRFYSYWQVSYNIIKSKVKLFSL